MKFLIQWWVVKSSHYLAFLLLVQACAKENIATVNEYEFVVPEHFPAPTYNFENNPISKQGFELGKRLFNDPLLSSDNSVACANCHIQATAFADSPIHPLSVGVGERIGKRNAPQLVNLAFYSEFMWDGGITHLDFVPINAIESDFEMNERLETVIQKLNQHPEYPALFKKAFQTNEITTPYLLKALSQFVLMMVSDKSRYDDYLKNNRAALNPQEIAGLALFKAKCSTCHDGVLLTDLSFRNNGLDSVFNDIGRALISEAQEDLGKFRVPSLRNIARTPPYMHDGRFETLEEVLQHYATAVKDSPTLDSSLKSDSKLGIALTKQEQTQIIAFLNTLTDFDFIANAKFRK